MSTILVVDDELYIRESLEMILLYENYNVLKAANAKEALNYLNKSDELIDVMLLDIKMPGMDGMELLEKVKRKFSEIEIIMISGHADIPDAVNAIKKGAYDFLEKPLDENRILITVRNALKNQKLNYKCQTLKKMLDQDRILLGTSPAMQEIFGTIQRVAPTEARILIQGENGTGKELVARSIHENSLRSDRTFIEVNCAAIPENLIESELFGHEKGSFTHAYEQRKGKFEQAQKGTIFLDEIGDMSLAAQTKILRILEENKVQRVGSSQTINIDVRIIAATNKDLTKACQSGEFREDLYYRLSVVPIYIKPLRERIDDIPCLVTHFLTNFSKKYNMNTKKITAMAMEKLQLHHWPGNVRELKNFIERLVILSVNDTITEEQIENNLHDPTKNMEGLFNVCDTYENFKKKSEKLFFLRKLSENSWNIKKTAEKLGMQRSNLYKKMEKYELSKPDG